MTRRLTTLLLTALIALTLLGAISGVEAFSIAAGGCLVAFALLVVRQLARAEIVLLSGTLTIGVLVVLPRVRPTPA